MYIRAWVVILMVGMVTILTGDDISQRKDEIRFVIDEPGGAEVLKYSDMKVTDCRGTVLDGYFRAMDGTKFAVVVNDHDAVYPMCIDPLSSSPDWVADSDQDSADFGYSVSGAGDVNGDGYSDVIVGARYYDNGQTDEGRAYVYHGSATGLSLTPEWTAESDQQGAYFGYSVSTAGDVNGDGYSDVIVSAVNYDNGQMDEGRAYVYHGSATGLSTTPDWTAESDQAFAGFGSWTSTAGDVNGDGYSDVIVGAYRYDNGENNEGRAYVYHGSAAGLSLTPDWTAESNQAYALFGWSVSGAGDVNGDGYSDVIVGAVHYDNGQTSEGRAYVYHGSATGLSLTPDWTAESDQNYAYFGYSVSSAGDVNADGYSDVIVGARMYTNGQTDEGRAFVYHGSATGLSVTSDWTAESNQAGADFGISVSTTGDVNADGYSDVIVGAPLYDNGQTDEGCAYVYHGGETGVNEYPSAISYPGLRLSVMYISGGVRFVCNVPAGMDAGDLVVYNLLGAEIDRVAMSLREAGAYHFEWSGQVRKGNILSSGVYFARVATGDAISNTVKFVLIK